jgi:hypothetical protein
MVRLARYGATVNTRFFDVVQPMLLHADTCHENVLPGVNALVLNVVNVNPFFFCATLFVEVSMILI